MKKVTTAIAATLLMGISSYAMAQATSTSPSAKPPANAAMNGKSGSTLMTANDVRHELEAKGYTGIRNVQQDKDGWKATATKNGKQVAVDVDRNGKIEMR